MNNTFIEAFNNVSYNGISNKCIGWCKEQHFTYNMEGLLLVVISTALVSLSLLLSAFGENILDKTDIKRDHLEIGIRLLLNLALVLNIGFFIWFLYFSNLR